MTLHDTIAAISTPLGTGGISIVRVSGRDAIAIVDGLFRGRKMIRDVRSHSIHYGKIVDPQMEKPVDEVLVTVMRCPRTYTREDTIEINCHGGALPARRILELVLDQGARLAEPGEFTKRAFLNGRIDLNQAEAVLDIITARTEKELQCGLAQLDGEVSRSLHELREKLMDLRALVEAYVDFVEEELPPYEQVLENTLQIEKMVGELTKAGQEGTLLSEGARVSIIGRPNVGKSSLLNGLLAEERAIVTSIPGTTRDALAEWMNIGGYPVRLVDTAGLRKARNRIESEGLKRTEASIADADIVLVVLDASGAFTTNDKAIIKRVKGKKTILVLNKIDIRLERVVKKIEEDMRNYLIIETSATRKLGLKRLKSTILQLITQGLPDHNGAPLITSARQRVAVSRCAKAIARARNALESTFPPEIVALELKEGVVAVDEAMGKRASVEVLDRVFSRFCIGK